MTPNHKYVRSFSAEGHDSLAIIARRIRKGSSVLDVGAGPGILGKYLSIHKQCVVDGIEADREQGDMVGPHYRTFVLADVQAGIPKDVAKNRYDYVVCADVIEHLRDPRATLRELRGVLAPGGRILVSTPNVAYAGVISGLLCGRFDYRTEGLLDETHVRFFTKRSVIEALNASGFHVTYVDSVIRPPQLSEFASSFAALGDGIQRSLLSRPDASAYQFVVEGSTEPVVDHVITILDTPPLFVAKLYWKTHAAAYSEERAQLLLGHQGRGQLVANILEQFSGIRFDPADRIGMLVVYDCYIVYGKGGTTWRWDGRAETLRLLTRHNVEVIESEGSVGLLVMGFTPWLELATGDMAAVSDGASVVIDCEWHDLSKVMSIAAPHLSGAIARDLFDLGLANKRLASELALKESEYQELVSSRSWRMTAPLRRFTRLIRREPPRPARGMRDRKQALNALVHEPVDVIVPVFKGIDQTRRCIESVLRSAGVIKYQLIVVDDASPETEVRRYVRSLVSDPRIVVIFNEVNVGFVSSVNRAMALHSARDVVLLNSDTEVANDWLDRLYRAAYSASDIGTVTPFSNNATICSFPAFCEENSFPVTSSVNSVDRVIAEVNKGRWIDIPTAVGFCMYIRRQCLSEVGLFDEDKFGKGYGEENDFCMRASAMGWRHVLDASTFVYHAGGGSFGQSAAARKAGATRVIDELYPHYRVAVAEHVAKDPANGLRVAAVLGLIRETPRPKILFVTHTLGGGTARHIGDLSRVLGDDAVVLVMQPGDFGVATLSCASPEYKVSINVRLARGSESLAVRLMKALDVTTVHVHHVYGFDVDVLRVFVRELSPMLVVTCHDYYPVCPQITLSTIHGDYCGEAGNKACAVCISERPSAGGLSIESWRAKHAWLVRDCDLSIAPSVDVRNRLVRYFPEVKSVAVHHPEGCTERRVRASNRHADGRLRILILGALSPAKGERYLQDCVNLSAEMDYPITFVHAGQFGDRVKGRGFISHGPYLDAEVQNVISAAEADIIWFPARVPETYSYTLSAALASGLPVVAFEIGAFKERMTMQTEAYLVPLATSPAEMIQLFLKFRSGAPQVHRSLGAVHDAQNGLTFYRGRYLELINAACKRDFRAEGRTSIMAIVTESELSFDACAYVRVLLPLRTAAIAGTVEYRCVTADEALRSTANVLIAQRTAVRTEAMAMKLREHCDAKGIRLVYEVDDDIFGVPSSHPEGDHYANALQGAKYLLRSADTVTVSTDALKERLSEHNDHIVVVPNALSSHLWAMRGVEGRRFDNHAAVRIAYIALPNHKPDFEMVIPALRELAKEYGGRLSVEIVGPWPNVSDRFISVLRPPAYVATHYPEFCRWLQQNCLRWDIGIAPLRDSPFNQTKSAIKYMEYAALGIPGVYSDVEPYRSTVVQGQTGITAPNDVIAWVQALKRFIDSPALRQAVAENAFEDLKSRHMLVDRAADWIQAWVPNEWSGTGTRPLPEESDQSRARNWVADIHDAVEESVRLTHSHRARPQSVLWKCYRRIAPHPLIRRAVAYVPVTLKRVVKKAIFHHGT